MALVKVNGLEVEVCTDSIFCGPPAGAENEREATFWLRDEMRKVPHAGVALDGEIIKLEVELSTSMARFMDRTMALRAIVKDQMAEETGMYVGEQVA